MKATTWRASKLASGEQGAFDPLDEGDGGPAGDGGAPGFGQQGFGTGGPGFQVFGAPGTGFPAG